MWRRAPDPITELPDHYREVHYMRVTQRGNLIRLNILSIIPMIASGLLVLGLLILYHEAGAPLVIRALPNEISHLTGLLIVVLILPVHELLHGVVIARAGHKPRYGFKLMVLYATADGALFRRNEFIQIALAPLVVISIAGVFIMAFLPEGLALWVGLAVMTNASGAIADIWMTAIVLRFSPAALIQDEADSMRVFAPEPHI